MNSIAVWTGANDKSTEGGWRWSSGKPFAFLNWAAGRVCVELLNELLFITLQYRIHKLTHSTNNVHSNG